MLPWYKSAVPRASAGVWVVPFVQFYVFPRASPSGIHKTALRVQIPYTLEVASFPGPARSSLAVRNSRRGPGLVHHVMCAAAYITSILLESMMS